MPPSQPTDTNGDNDLVAELRYRIDGPDDGRALVLGNSIGTTAGLWDEQMPAFVRDFRVVRYEHPGHGGSPSPPGPYSIEVLAGDVLALLDRLGIERASFAGISLGGMVAMSIGTNAPERVDRLALCCTSAGLGRPDHWTARAATVRAEGMAVMVEPTLERWLTLSFRTAHPAAVARLAAMLGGVDPDGYAGCCEAIGAMDQRESIAAITAPTLVLAGADDPATPPSHAETIHDRIAGSTLVVLDGAAHLANIDRPEAFTDAVLAHLAPK
jgi:3-oxoadipate enol-lactonase